MTDAGRETRFVHLSQVNTVFMDPAMPAATRTDCKLVKHIKL